MFVGVQLVFVVFVISVVFVKGDTHANHRFGKPQVSDIGALLRSVWLHGPLECTLKLSDTRPLQCFLIAVAGHGLLWYASSVAPQRVLHEIVLPKLAADTCQFPDLLSLLAEFCAFAFARNVFFQGFLKGQSGPGSVRFGYGLGVERFDRFRFSVPAVPLQKGFFCVSVHF